MKEQKVTIAGYHVGRVGYGTMQLTGPMAMGDPADPEACKTVLRSAIEHGVRLIDTSAYYGPEIANRLLAEAIAPYPDDLLVATKVGARRTPDGGFAADTTPEAVRSAVHDNLRQLGLDTLSVVHARYMPDSTVPFEETVGALADLRNEGLIAHIGVSNVTLELFKGAQTVAPIASVENEFRLGHEGGRDVLDAATQLGIPYLAFRPLGNGALVAADSPLHEIARHAGVSAATLALAWVLDQSDTAAVIPGSSSPEHLTADLAAQSFEFTADLREELARLEMS
ncbi:aldo/keto reductase [Phytoactinopolyspora endophytica]|uniref:aldo/keto reductase n=1 Tax=Phytoactinopolyspora endophytica TaxID=1642495 RepID=UPI0013EC65D7|nr:aldo/keto reductase [Phytoactinopolyspora endophytica]